jgi:TusA-related sulfurtransferase
MRGRSCPTPIVELMRTVRELDPDETVEVTADDKAFPADVKAWCQKTGNTLVSLVYVAVVKKSAPHA